MASTLGFEPGPHWWEAIALTTAPSLGPSKGTSTTFRMTVEEFSTSTSTLFNKNSIYNRLAHRIAVANLGGPV